MFGGRWNSPGQAAVNTSTNLSLAALETLVHVDFDNLPTDLVWVKINLPDAASLEVSPHPIAPDERDATAFGDSWLRSRTALALVVPSAVLSVEKNIIFNPMHSEIGTVSTLEINVFEFDNRLFSR